MSVGNIQASNGLFIITDASGNKQQVDLGALIMMLKLQQTENLDEQLAIQLAEIQERNERISLLTEFMSICRTMKAGGKDDGDPTGNCKITINGVSKNIQGSGGWVEYFGISWSDAIGNRESKKSNDDKAAWDANWDANINNLKGKIDTLNNDSQLANIKLQNVLEKRNNAFEMATQAMDTNNQSVASTIRNL